MKRWVKVICVILVVLLLIGFLVSLMWFLNGSLEMYPTDEQEEKAKMTSLFFMIFFASTSIACIFPTIKKKDKK